MGETSTWWADVGVCHNGATNFARLWPCGDTHPRYVDRSQSDLLCSAGDLVLLLSGPYADTRRQGGRLNVRRAGRGAPTEVLGT